MGQLRKRGGVWWIRYYRDGRRFEESSRSEKYEEARDLLRTREGAIASGAPVSSKIGRYRFEDAAADITTEYDTNGRKSAEKLETRLRLRLTPFFGGRRMSTISTADVRRYTKQQLDAGLAPATINRDLAALKRMFSLAIKANLLIAKPHIPMLREQNVRIGFFERPDFDAVRAQLPEAEQAVVTFAYLTGWRGSEVLGLQWRQVDLEAGTVRLDPGTTKNGEGRLFPFGHHLPELAELLQVQRRRTDAVEKAKGLICPWVFHRNGKAIRSYRGAWARACAAAGLAGRIPHDFRRTAVRNLERAGVSRSVAMQLTGHKTEAVYRRYAIVSDADLGEGLAKLGTLLTGTKAGTVGARGRVRRFRQTTKTG
jgi:integrase